MTWPSSIPITFTRTGATGSRFNGAGVLVTGIAADTPRLDFDPVTKAARGLLIEAAFTNLITRSEELAHADWVASNATVTGNDLAAPDGATSADLIAASSTSAGGSHISQSKTATASTRFAASAFFRKRDTNWACITIYDGAGAGRRFWFNISTGALGSNSATGSGLTLAGTRIEDCGGGWYRCHAVVTFAANTTANVEFYPALDADASIGVTNTRGNHAFGLMAGVGEDCGSYVKTTSASQARGADTGSLSTTGLLRPTGFTIYSEFVLMQAWQTAQRRGGAVLHDGTGANHVYSGWSQSPTNFTDGIVVSSSPVYQDAASPTPTAGAVVKHAMRVSANDFRGCWNGTLNDADTSGAVPATTTLQLGGRNSQIEPLNGWLRRVRLFPRALTDAQLQALTA